MTPFEDAKYRMRLAREHLDDASFEYDHARWSKAALSAQLSIENSAKATLSLFGPLAKTHDLAGALLELRSSAETDEMKKTIMKLAEITEKFGVKEHVLTTYGDEVALKTPHEIYDQPKAQRALEMAQEALRLSSAMVEE